MKNHPNEERLAALYDLFKKGKFDEVLAMCEDTITFIVPGKTSFSGVHTKSTFGDWVMKIGTISNGTFREVPYNITANDNEGVVLLDHFLIRRGKEYHYRVAHLWGIQNGKFTRWEEWPGDETAFNSSWM